MCTYTDDDDDDSTTTTTATATTVAAVGAASNGPVDTADDDKLVEWLSSCDAADDEILHKVRILDSLCI